MTNKGHSFPYEFVEQFAKVMGQSAALQTEWWKQTGLALENHKQYQEFMDESQSRLHDFLEGVKLYRQTDFKREIKEPPVIWALGGAKLLDYSQTKDPDA